MLKFTKGLFAILGLAATACLVYFMITMFWRYNNVRAMALANHGTMPADPKWFMWLAPAAALVAGLMFGLAMALPSRTARSIRNESRAEFEHGTVRHDTLGHDTVGHDTVRRDVVQPEVTDERRI